MFKELLLYFRAYALCLSFFSPFLPPFLRASVLGGAKVLAFFFFPNFFANFFKLFFVFQIRVLARFLRVQRYTFYFLRSNFF